MDFVFTLPRTPSNCDGIWLIVDCLTKSAHFLPMCKTFFIKKLAHLFVSHRVSLHGVLVLSVSDTDLRFASKF